jgi:hypothetical protein
MGMASSQLSLYSRSTNQVGDLYINGDEVFQIHDCEFNLTGTIFVKDDSTLDVQNVTLNLIRPQGSNTTDVLTATDRSHVLITNSTIVLGNYDYDHAEWVSFTGYDQTEINITESTFKGSRFIANTYDISTINIENSNMTTDYSEIATFGSSSLHIENSTIPTLVANNNSIEYVKNSLLSNVVTCFGQGHTTVNITDSWVDWVASWDKGSCRYTIRNSTIFWFEVGPNSSAYITDSSGNQLNVDENATAVLVGSSWNHIIPEGTGVVLVGNWFFGLSFPGIVGVPYTWVLPLEIVIIVLMIIGIGALIFEMQRVRMKKKKAETADLYRA